MHDNLIIGVAVLAAFVLSITLVLYGLRFLDQDRQWRPRRYGLSAREMPCSFCGKMVRTEAVICRYCHHRLDEVIDADAPGEAIVAEDALVPAEAVTARKPVAARAAAAAMPSSVIAEEDLSKNKTFVWLDTAFEQITERGPVTEWGPEHLRSDVRSETAAPASQSAGSVPMVRAIGLISTIPLPEARDWRNWFTKNWFVTRKREWGIAAAIAIIAFVVGGSTFLRGSSDTRVEKKGDYVTFDVSERAPLVAVPDLKPGERSAAAAPTTAAPKALAPKAPTSGAPAPVPGAPAAAVAQAPGAVSAPMPAPAMAGAAPEFQAPSSQAAAVPPPGNLVAAVPPTAPVGSSAENWTSTVSNDVDLTYPKNLVVAVQRLIRAEGFDPGPIDGLVGPRTRRAILAYQVDGGLPPSGEIDRALLVNLQLAGRTVHVIGPMNGGATAGRR